ncbi:MAG: hypothetical protein N2747_03580 [Chitinophagaceae bacterium]|nr:hypothetical protein [Chitinophagaceae bacterium]
MNSTHHFSNIPFSGRFLSSADGIKKKFKKIKAFLYDWDGVFNDGTKNADGSPFSEVDSMGTNLLRYALFLDEKKVAPAAIITGVNNHTALRFAQREHFQAVYFDIKNKTVAFRHFLEFHKLQAAEVVYFFDDVVDLDIARYAGLRIFIPHPATHLLTEYVRRNGLADYICFFSGGQHAVREAADLLLYLSGYYEQIIQERSAFSKQYETYLTERKTIETKIFHAPSETGIKELAL